MIGKELINRAEIIYGATKKIDNSYMFVSKLVSKKTANLIDKLHIEKFTDSVERTDIIDILEINTYFKQESLKTPGKRINGNDLYKTTNFLNIIKKYDDLFKEYTINK